MNTAPNNHKLRVVHIMKDGEVRDSIEGLTPPADNGCYEVLRQILTKRERREGNE